MTSKNPTMRCFTQKDAIPDALQGERIAVLGYGHLGRPFAMNLRDSGITNLAIGNIADEYAEQAAQEGFTVHSIGQATSQASVILILLPDEVIPEVFAADIAPNLHPNSAIVLGSGYTLAYGLVTPPANIDVLLLAPRMAGENARQRFLNQQGFYAFVSVEQDASHKAWRRLLGLADGVGILRAGALELNAKLEADLDLLVEQTLGAALGASILSVFTLGTEIGIPPEALVMEMYISEEMEMVWRSFREKGFFLASSVHGPTALYGGFIRTMQIMQSELIQKYREALSEIHNGEFAQKFQAEREAGYPSLTMARAMTLEDAPITLAEKHLLALLSGA